MLYINFGITKARKSNTHRIQFHELSNFSIIYKSLASNK